jgi:hypothetical protein
MKDAMKLRITILISIFLVIPITTWAGYYQETCASWNNGRCERYDKKYIGEGESSSGPVVKYGAIAYGKANRSYGASEKGDVKKGTFVQKLLCIPHEEYFTKRSLRLKKADG